MIQRIQTLYLFIIASLMMALFFLPLSVVQLGSDFYTFDVSGLNSMTTPSELVFPIWALMGLAAVIVLAAFVALFMYKKRILQVRICVFNALLLIGFYGLVAYFTWEIAKPSDIFHFSPRIALGFPLISLILDYLAIRSIGADEALIRSLERLR